MSMTSIRTIRGVATGNTIDFVHLQNHPQSSTNSTTKATKPNNANTSLQQTASNQVMSTPKAKHVSIVSTNSIQQQQQQQSQPSVRSRPPNLIFDNKGNLTQKAFQLCQQIGINEEDLYKKSINDFKEKNSNSTSQTVTKAENDVAILKYQHYEKRRQQRIQQISHFLRLQEEKQKEVQNNVQQQQQQQPTQPSPPLLQQQPQQQQNQQSNNGSLESRTPALNSPAQLSPKTPLVKCKTRAMKENRVREIFQEIPYDDKMRLVNKINRVKKRIQVNQRNEFANQSNTSLNENNNNNNSNNFPQIQNNNNSQLDKTQYNGHSMKEIPPSSTPDHTNAFITSPTASKGFAKTGATGTGTNYSTNNPPNTTRDRSLYQSLQPQNATNSQNPRINYDKEKQEQLQRRQQKQERVKEMEEIRAMKQETEVQTQREIQVRIKNDMLGFLEKEEAKERAAFLKQHVIFKRRSQDRQQRQSQKIEQIESCVAEAKNWLEKIESKQRQNQERKSVSLEKAKRSRSLNHSNMTAIIKQNQILNQQARQQYEQECLKGYISAIETKPPVRDWSEVRQKREGLQLSALEKRQENEKIENDQRESVQVHLNSKISHANQNRQSNIEANFKLINSKNQLARSVITENLRFNQFSDQIHREQEEQRNQHKQYIVENRKLLKEDLQYISANCARDLGKSLALQELLHSQEFQQTKQHQSKQQHHRNFKSANVSPSNLSASVILKESAITDVNTSGVHAQNPASMNKNTNSTQKLCNEFSDN